MLLPLLAACSPPSPVAPPATLGPYAVGHQRVSVTYTPIGMAPRTLQVEVWYPAEEGDNPYAEYVVAGVTPVSSAFARSEAPVLPGDHPVLLYSHGAGGEGAVAYPYGERAAANGWVVVAPDHAGDTALDVAFGNADWMAATFARPQDLRALLDSLEDGDLQALLEGRVDATHTVAMGHSFGGYTVLAASGAGLADARTYGIGLCAVDRTPGCDLLEDDAAVERLEHPPMDPRIRGTIAQAPGLAALLSTDALAGLQVPVFLQTAAHDGITPVSTADVAWGALDHPQDRWLQLENAAHMSFVPLCDDVSSTLLASTLAWMRDEGCDAVFTPTSEVVPALADYTLAFGASVVDGGGSTDGLDDLLLPDSVLLLR